MLLVLITEPVDRPGGILRLTRTLVDEMRQYRPVRVISKAGGAWSTPVEGCRNSTLRFIARALYAAASYPGADVLATHLNLSPLALTAARLARGRAGLLLYGEEIQVSRTRLRSFAAQHSDLVMAISRATADGGRYLLGIPGDRVRVVTPGIVLPTGWPREVVTDAIRVLTVSRLDESYKNIAPVIAAMRETQLANARLTIVGDGPARRQLEELAVRLEVDSRVLFVGTVADSDLHQLYSEADVFVLPSTGEGFGLVYAEAMAHGLPCVGARGGGSADAISHGETGCLVDSPVEAKDVAEAVSWVLNPVRYSVLSDRARRRANESFSADAFGRRLRDAFGAVPG